MLDKLKKAFGYSALESVGSRGFDFITLWVLLNTLPTVDLADFGLATSVLFIFNVLLVVPETSLLKHQKEWMTNGTLPQYVTTFYCFSLAKSLSLLILLGISYWLFGYDWQIVAVALALGTQLIQAAEIGRIYLRMELQQKRVAKVEILTKSLLATLCLAQFVYPGLSVYLTIYLCWTFSVACFWAVVMLREGQLGPIDWETFSHCFKSAFLGFSLWQHFSGVITFYLYNVDPLFLKLNEVATMEIATYTAALKVSNLFFVVPMFLQSFVPVILANAGEKSEHAYQKLVAFNAALSLVQLLSFVTLGAWLSPFFGVTDETAKNSFYVYGSLICVGVFLLNMARPLSTYLLIRLSPRLLFPQVFIPTLMISTMLFAVLTWRYGAIGCAVASAVAYGIFGTLLLVCKIRHSQTIHDAVSGYSGSQ
ncbi:hypothetical protein HOP62_01930 [Halomonas sp. MCCC 1A17488]|uniref:lipopolysaccharide biosynthesis protein n=1 Tax=unclassified Halomonas TaxID=2609666 RepID=UPI0018D22779|nr:MULTISPECIES: hypothetical protein [unclassified Halomonas]MCE8014831.1 hypothetical protein [Halomonas sp. MCCC 1A17488]MCG3238164.1 hypothetical protein [Halomonas sp. MCCC 1A17488]QPP48068.1 hypothetical protein I4484_12470 [Halomonas sp. SS10-MC5]